MPNGQERANINKGSSVYDQTEKIFSDLVDQLKDREFKTLLDKFNSEFVAAKPTTELTDDDIEDIEQAKKADRLQRKCEYARNLSKAIIKRMSGSTDSKLFITAKKILDLLDEIEAGDESKWRQLDTATYVLVQLCRGVDKKQAETGQKACCLLKKIIGWIFKKTSHFICAIVVAVIATIIAAIIVDILADFGWIERIKDFFTK
ncbi:MAG: hypothetical protein A2167_01850 [Planctomycetes bacterium RBG_13_46_10]|nr:MAG: hypothetical protein A2167_01850 [Planctomycetes bacterium RBG_13_46_10]QBM02892.1 hypothetical protein [uncultured archaeon]